MTIERLGTRIERFMRTNEGDFHALALELFRYQFDKNALYQAYCRAQQRTPENVTTWQDIPAVPISAFKSAELATFPVGQAAAIFHSSGTTLSSRSKHFLKTLSYYETSLIAGFEKWALRDKAAYFVLAPSAGEAPRSSLSWMLDVVKRKWGGPGSDFFIQRGVVEDLRLCRALESARAAGKPVMLLGTTLAFLAFFDQCAKANVSFRCPAGSRLMDTGGMKTQKRQVARDEFLRLVWAHLGIPEAECINEYGMSEMSSQFYARGSSPIFQGPPWTRTNVVDGALQHVDLANIDSVMAIRTEDAGSLVEDGFVLQGRLPAADLKGCSLDLEAYLG